MSTSNPPSAARRKLTELLDAAFLARLDGLDLVSRKILQGKLQGERRSKRRGTSAEFADHRPYVAGDDLRFVDWNIYGRLEQFFLKLFLEEQDLTVDLLVDVSASMGTGTPPKDRFARKLAAALAYVALVNNSRLTVSLFADGIVARQAGLRGRACLPRLAELLLNAENAGRGDFDKAARQAAEGRLGAGVMVVISDFLFKGGADAGLRRLVAGRYDLYALQVLSPQELSPPLTGDLRLVDVEDAQVAEVTISNALLKRYHRNLADWCGRIQAFCAARGATFVQARSSDAPEALVLTYLRKIGMLR